jgi:hypothetical protein
MRSADFVVSMRLGNGRPYAPGTSARVETHPVSDWAGPR